MEDANERDDYGAFKKCMARLGKRKTKPNKMAEGSYDEHGVLTSYEGDMVMMGLRMMLSCDPTTRRRMMRWELM